MAWPLILLTLFISPCTIIADPKASTRYGDVEGFVYRMKNGEDANIFLGIPYASPPTGALRFERTIPVKPWSGTKKTIDYGASCFPHHKDGMLPSETYDEMCLYLNVMAPSKKSASLLGYPVIVFIHGGGFVFSSSRPYGYKTISDNFVSEGVVFVTINYRLGFLGFLTTGDDALPGNAGLWDQTQALIFISENIAAFGGDPQRITVMGQSAGAASVSALSLSPRSNVYFQRAIAFSGSIFCEFAINDVIVADNIKLIKTMGCDSEDTSAMRDCMKKLEVDKIMDGVEKIGSSRRSKNMLKFHPRVDGQFFPHTPEELLTTAPQMSSLVGVTDAEASFFVLSDAFKFLSDIAVPESEQKNFSADDLSKYIRTIMANKEQFGCETEELQRQLIEFFVQRDIPENADSSFYLSRLENVVSDMMFNMGIYHEVQLKVSNNWTTYFFVQEYHNSELHANRPIKGAYHGNEFPYLYGFSFMENIKFNDEDIEFKRNLLSSILQFVKTGSPTDEHFEWLPVDKSHPSRYLSMTPKPTMKEEYKPHNVHFWTKVVSKEVSRHVTTGMKFTGTTSCDEHTEL
uniref:Carboxylic ester hydrolase n=1 Tax=Parascaris univalens TaxID=6257 RepID=A0A915BU30_PARUN